MTAKNILLLFVTVHSICMMMVSSQGTGCQNFSAPSITQWLSAEFSVGENLYPSYTPVGFALSNVIGKMKLLGGVDY